MLYWALAVVAVVLVFKYVLPLFLPFVISVLLALFIDPLVNAAEDRLRLPRGPVVAMILLAVVGAILVASCFGFSRLVTELAELYRQLPSYRVQAWELADRVLELAGRVSAALPPPLQQSLDDQWARAYRGVEAFIGRLLSMVRALPNLVVVMVFSLMGTYFLSRDKVKIMGFVLGMLPPSYRQKAVAIKSEVVMSVLGFVKAQLLLVLFTMVLNIAGLMILRVQYAVVIGLAAGILDVLPVVGPALIFLPWALYTLVLGDIWMTVGLLVLYSSISVARQAANARLVGRGIGIHPLTTLIALYLGIRLFGPVGLVVGPMVAIILKAMINAGLIGGPDYGGTGS